MSTTNDNTPEATSGSVEITDDLDTFSDELFGQSKSATPEEATSEPEEVEDTEDEDDAPLADEGTHDEDPEETDEEDTEDEDSEEPQPEAPKKKNRFQERIDELTGKAREAERREAALQAKLDEILNKLNTDTQQTPKNTPTTPTPEATGRPDPNALNEDGTDKYPLGEFDPEYVLALTRFALEEDRRRSEEQREQLERDTKQAELRTEWNNKLGAARERYPDFQEKGQALVSTFDGIDPAYGEYLSTAIMSMEYGTDVLYYLANHPDEANRIVQSGPSRATLALGRIEAKFALADEEKNEARPKVSKAPTPPARLNKGSAAARIEVPDDTDDLDAFEKKLFKKR